jgi:hypothetical protein
VVLPVPGGALVGARVVCEGNGRAQEGVPSRITGVTSGAITRVSERGATVTG